MFEWKAAKTPVTFYQYEGTYTLDNLPQTAAYKFETDSDQNDYVPDDNCQLFHMNLWMGNYGQGNVHPGPSNGQNQEVIVTNFQYRP